MYMQACSCVNRFRFKVALKSLFMQIIYAEQFQIEFLLSLQYINTTHKQVYFQQQFIPSKLSSLYFFYFLFLLLLPLHYSISPEIDFLDQKPFIFPLNSFVVAICLCGGLAAIDSIELFRLVGGFILLFLRVPHQQDTNKTLDETHSIIYCFAFTISQALMTFNFKTHQKLVIVHTWFHMDETHLISLLINSL